MAKVGTLSQQGGQRETSMSQPTYDFFSKMCLIKSGWSEKYSKLIKLYLTPSHPIIKAEKDNTLYEKMPQSENILCVRPFYKGIFFSMFVLLLKSIS